MNMQIKFSVTVPAYKALFLGECIDSILAQTYKNFEVIIVNDASPQDLDSIVNRYDDPRIRYYKNQVGFGAEHVVGNWNKCLEYATGDYVICMGDDDKLIPNCLEEYAKLINMFPNLNVYHGMTEIIDENSQISSMQEPRPLWESAYSMLWWRWRGRSQYIGDWLFKTNALKEQGGFFDTKFAWGADDVSAFLASIKGGVANTYIPVFQYRVSNLTISKNTSNTLDKIKSHNKVFETYRKLLKDEPSNDVDCIYWKLLTKFINKYSDQAIGNDIADDIISHPFRLIHWFRHIGKDNVSKRAILYSIYVFIKIKILIRNK